MSADIVVTGATGFLGHHVMAVLQKAYSDRVIGVGRRDYDLLDATQVTRLFDDLHPRVLIHLAGYSGGIGANAKWPADFFHQNILLTSLMFREAAIRGVEKMVYVMGGCSYPATATSPIDEGQMWDGFPQLESAGYSMAKKMGLLASQIYRQQYGLNSAVLIPGNMFGEWDNFRNEESHVIPALIRRFFEAKRDGLPQVAMWGTGGATRDFVYAGDVAAAFPHFIESYSSPDPVNVSSGACTSIRELATTIASAVGYTGELVWDTSKPDGQLMKIFSVTRLKSLGLSCDTPLRAGLEKTICWFTRAYETRSADLRL